MRFLVLLGVLFVVSGHALPSLDFIEWNTWKTHHGKNYASIAEEKFRMKVYMENKYKIQSHNNRFHKGEHTFQMKMNHFGDLLGHEFTSKMNGFLPALRQKTNGPPPTGAIFLTPENVNIPESIDWRKLGAVTEVKNQGGCGSCWAFSTTGALEGQHFRKTGNLTSLSEQQLVDCSKSNSGCDGGMMDAAFKYIKHNGGIDTEASYPYQGVAKECRYNPQNKGAWDVGFVDIPEFNEQKLMEAVATVGPCSVAIDASHDSFQFYHSGVYSEPRCAPRNLDHGVLVVGYGEENGQKYWLIKNSWSAKWGEKGYMKMAREEGNMCGIASMASFPLV